MSSDQWAFVMVFIMQNVLWGELKCYWLQTAHSELTSINPWVMSDAGSVKTPISQYDQEYLHCLRLSVTISHWIASVGILHLHCAGLWWVRSRSAPFPEQPEETTPTWPQCPGQHSPARICHQATTQIPRPSVRSTTDVPTGLTSQASPGSVPSVGTSPKNHPWSCSPSQEPCTISNTSPVTGGSMWTAALWQTSTASMTMSTLPVWKLGNEIIRQ